MSRRWKFRLAIYTLLAAGLGVGTWWAFQWAEMRDGPDVIFAGTHPEAVAKMLEMAAVTKDDVVYDLGCGDGRILIAAAKKYGCRAVGFEIQPHLIEAARRNAADAGVADLVEVHDQDLFTVDLRPATVVTLYLLPQINVKLIPQLKQLRPGARIVSYLFEIEGVRPTQRIVYPLSNEQTRILYLWLTPLEFEAR